MTTAHKHYHQSVAHSRVGRQDMTRSDVRKYTLDSALYQRKQYSAAQNLKCAVNHDFNLRLINFLNYRHHASISLFIVTHSEAA